MYIFLLSWLFLRIKLLKFNQSPKITGFYCFLNKHILNDGSNIIRNIFFTTVSTNYRHSFTFFSVTALIQLKLGSLCIGKNIIEYIYLWSRRVYLVRFTHKLNDFTTTVCMCLLQGESFQFICLYLSACRTYMYICI